MYNLIISLAAGALVAAAIALGTSFGWVAAIVPGVLVTAGVYVWIAFRVRKQLDAINAVVQHELQARHVEKAIQALQAGFPLAPWQFLVGPQLHASIGMLRYLTDDLDGAVPELEQGLRNYFGFYNGERLHQSLDYRTPGEVYGERSNACGWVGS